MVGGEGNGGGGWSRFDLRFSTCSVVQPERQMTTMKT
jgi:hypothetical protein